MALSLSFVGLDELLLIAEQITRTPAERIAAYPRFVHAESALAAPAASFAGHDFCPDVVQKAAVPASRLVRNHPQPDGNKRLAFVTMRLFLIENGASWQSPGAEGVDRIFRRLAGATMSEGVFERWLRRHVAVSGENAESG